MEWRSASSARQFRLLNQPRPCSKLCILAPANSSSCAASKASITRDISRDHTRYLSRPGAQLETYRAGAGSSPIAYMLGNRGADLLAHKYGWRRAVVDWTAKA